MSSVEVFESLFAGDKALMGEVSAVAFIKLLFAAKRAHPIPLAKHARTDVEALMAITHVTKQKAAKAIADLTDPADPMIAFEGEVPRRFLRILSYEKHVPTEGMERPSPQSLPASSARAPLSAVRAEAGRIGGLRAAAARAAVQANGKQTFQANQASCLKQTLATGAGLLAGGVGGDLSDLDLSLENPTQIPEEASHDVSISSREVQAKPKQTGPTPSPARSDPGTQASENPYLLSALERGIESVTGVPLAFPPVTRATIRSATNKHALKDGRSIADVASLQEWVFAKGAAYARYRSTVPETERDFWPDTPNGWMRWLNAGAPPSFAAKRSSGIWPSRRETLVQPTDPDAPWLQPGYGEGLQLG